MGGEIIQTPISFEKVRTKMSLEEVNTRWQAEMAPFFEIPDNSKPDQMMIELEEVFHVD